MEAVILAGGKGTRLKPYTATIPKPLVPVGERPILGIVIGRLKAAGVTKITLTVNHMAEIIMAFFGTGEKFGVEIVYSIEDEMLGTVAPVRLLKGVPEHFIVMNGDVLTDLDYADLFRNHIESGARLTIATYRREQKVDFGVLEMDRATKRVIAFREKPTYEFDVSMGVYVYSRSLLDRIPSSGPYSFDELVLDMLKDGDPINAYPYDGYWLDIGRPDDYDQANLDVDRIIPAEGK